MAQEAEATREARAKVISAEGEKKASEALRDAADVMAQSPAALQVHLSILSSSYFWSYLKCGLFVDKAPLSANIEQHCNRTEFHDCFSAAARVAEWLFQEINIP